MLRDNTTNYIILGISDKDAPIKLMEYVEKEIKPKGTISKSLTKIC